MAEVWRVYGDVLVAFVLALPGGAVAAWALVGWRCGRGADLGVALRRSVAEVGAVLGTALIETAQYALALGRVSSVDDVLLNALGAGLAAVGSRRWWSRRAAASREFAPIERRH